MVKNEIINTYQINPEKIDIVHNGIELKEMDYSKSFEKLSLEFSILKNQFRRKITKDLLCNFFKI